jgi:hypothetical protein
MNKNVLNKLSKIESKVELSEINVELATIYDDLNGTIAEANQGAMKALDMAKQGATLCKESINKNNVLLKELDRAEGLIQQLGLDSELKKVQNAKVLVNKNLDTIQKIYTELLAI